MCTKQRERINTNLTETRKLKEPDKGETKISNESNIREDIQGRTSEGMKASKKQREREKRNTGTGTRAHTSPVPRVLPSYEN